MILENYPRYRCRKIDLGKLLENDQKLIKKKFNLIDVFDKSNSVKDTHLSAGETIPGNELHKIPGENTVRYLSLKEYIAIISMILASMYLLLISFFPLLYNFTSSFEPIDFLKNLLYFIAGLGTFAGVYHLFQKETHLQHIADETFDRVIYQRLEPVLKDVAEVQVGINGVQDQLEMMNINIGTLANKRTEALSGTSYQMTDYIKYIILINITLAVFLFMLQYPLGYIPYAVTVLFILWWIMITAEFKLWNVEIAWTWAFFPIILLPIYTIIMNAYLKDYQLFGSLAIGLCIYVISYYSWCSYIVKGVLPFDLQDVIKNNHEKNPITNAIALEKIRYLKLDFKLNALSRHNIATGLILFSIVLFGIAWLGYAVQHDLISGINRETMGGFEWPSSYTYIVNLLGIFLIFIGFKMLKQ